MIARDLTRRALLGMSIAAGLAFAAGPGGALAERIAVFDNDGTLWAEQPVYFQFAFALDRVKALAPQHPEWKTKDPFKSVLANDTKGAAAGEKGMLQILAATHAGMTVDEFHKTVLDWTATARHPRFDRLTLSWSISRCWSFWPICAPTASRRSSSRAAASSSCGPGWRKFTAFRPSRWWDPPAWSSSRWVRTQSRCCASSRRMSSSTTGPASPSASTASSGGGRSSRSAIPTAISRCCNGPPRAPGRASWGSCTHTDAEREWAYDRKSLVGKLDKALDEGTAKGWTIVDMKRDWRKVFAFQP